MPRLLEQRPPQLSLQLGEAHRPPSRLEMLTKELGHRRERESGKKCLVNMGQSNTNTRPSTPCPHLTASLRSQFSVFIPRSSCLSPGLITQIFPWERDIDCRVGDTLTSVHRISPCTPHWSRPLIGQWGSSTGLWLAEMEASCQWLRCDGGIWVFTLLGGGISHTHLLGTLSTHHHHNMLGFKLINNINSSHTGARRGILPIEDPFPPIEEHLTI